MRKVTVTKAVKAVRKTEEECLQKWLEIYAKNTPKTLEQERQFIYELISDCRDYLITDEQRNERASELTEILNLINQFYVSQGYIINKSLKSFKTYAVPDIERGRRWVTLLHILKVNNLVRFAPLFEPAEYVSTKTGQPVKYFKFTPAKPNKKASKKDSQDIDYLSLLRQFSK